jgi:uncharacterized YigZ family protein
MALKPYKTFIKAADDSFIINKSRFIGHGCPCETEEEALKFLSDIRAKHKDANHNCYAYIIGSNMGVMRYSDDGEPGGTAGMPIIEVMKARGVTNCAVVVTRYFGGVLLGAGGLVRAYSQGAAAAINACGVGVMHPTARYLMEVSYPITSMLYMVTRKGDTGESARAFMDWVLSQQGAELIEKSGYVPLA